MPPGRRDEAEELPSTSPWQRRVGLWILGSILLLILSITIFVSAVSADGDGHPEENPTTPDAATQQLQPSVQARVGAVKAELVSLVSEVEKQYSVTVGVSLQADGGVLHVGDAGDLHAWSTVKIPIALAAVQHARTADGQDRIGEITEDLTRAVAASDNDAALRLWESLGSDAESAAAVDGVFRQAADPTDAERDRTRSDYEGFGDVHWSLDNQVLFADRLACLDGAEPVLDAMGKIIPEHRQGLGLLEGARFKGGWGQETDGTYLLREFGLVGDPGSQVPVAYAVLPGDRSDATARQAAEALVTRMAPLVRTLSTLGGMARCQLPQVVPTVSMAAPVRS